MLTTDLLATLRWWLVLMLLGAAATPLAYTIFRRLPDRGYAFTKMVGLLVAAYLFWILTSLGFLGNNLGGILLALTGLILLSYWLYRRERQGGLLAWLYANRHQILLTELVFAATFLLWAWVRAQNPAITGTEKPMEFAFLNAAARSDTFPPVDPWLSGFAISYYYFGYVMTSLVARLAFVAEPVAFNLAIAWLAAGTAVGAFGLVYNLAAAIRPGRLARSLALVAAIAIPLAGNMEALLEVLYANDIASSLVVATDPVSGEEQNLWQWLNVREINRSEPPATPRYEGGSWWWWRASRVIYEAHLSGRPEPGLEPIAEFPAFSFILGDLHPHVLALPFAFLSLALAYVWWSRPAAISLGAWREGGWLGGSLLMLRRIGWPLLGFTILLLGGLSFLNTWDVFIHLFIILGAFMLAQWREHGRWHMEFMSQTLLLGLTLSVAAILLYLPFYLGFRSQTGPPFLLPMLMRPTRLAQFLIIFFMPLMAIAILLGSLAIRRRAQHLWTALVTAASLIGALFLFMLLLTWIIAATPEGAGRLAAIAGEVGVTLAQSPDVGLFSRLSWALTAVLRLAPVTIAARLAVPGVTLLLALIAGLVVMLLLDSLSVRRHAQLSADDRLTTEGHQASEAEPLSPEATTPDSGHLVLPFILLLVLTGALLTLGPEFVYLRDQFGQRLNTIFKFYYQAWVLFGVAALAGLAYLLHHRRTVGLVATALYTLTLAAALLFPLLAVRSRAAEYQAIVGGDQVATLDGLAYLRQTRPDEYQALLWLRDHVDEPAVIVEAVGGQYTDFGRVAAATGLPTLLGWAGHEYQWRGSTPEPAVRDEAVRQIYTNRDWQSVVALLNQYGVDYIYLGEREMQTYGGPAIQEKFDARLEVAYRNEGVTIYRWRPQVDQG